MSSADTLERLKGHLVDLKFASALEILDETIGRLERSEISAVEALDQLLDQEHCSRESRRIMTQLRTSRLLQHKTLDTFDFTFQPTLDRQRVMALAELAFIERKQCVHFLGPPGVGKTQVSLLLVRIEVTGQESGSTEIIRSTM